MASVTSLDQDMKMLRLGRYTPQAANEVKVWIESTLREKLPGGDLLEILKDGTVLCKLVNLALAPPGVKFKKSPMPFIQMENISQFLSACERPPLSLPAHDRFLTVDLYESKDPAQVLQCLGAFSRVAHSLNPRQFPSVIGPKKGLNAQSPNSTGDKINGGAEIYGRGGGATSSMSQTSWRGGSSTFNPAQRTMSPHITGGSTKSTEGGPKSPPGGVSSWSKKSDQATTAPAWNIHQYGYMGGASQGNQGIAFGARRQITTPGPKVPSLAEKEKLRKEKEAEDQRQQALTEEAERRRRQEIEEEEELERQAEERRWEDDTRRGKEEERHQVEAQKRKWEEQERRWKADEEQRLQEEKEVQDRFEKETQRKRGISDARLQGQFLSQYQSEQASKSRSRRNSIENKDQVAERDRIQELERQLEEAKERERQYQQEREEREERRAQKQTHPKSRSRSRSRPAPKSRNPSPRESDVSWVGDEREYLRKQWSDHHQNRPLPEPSPKQQEYARTSTPPSLPARPLPEPTATVVSPPSPSRPLPDPMNYQKSPQARSPFVNNRTDKFLASNPASTKPSPNTFTSPDHALSSAAENALESQRRMQAQQKNKAGAFASMSILEREMELERQRQKEWEASQLEKANLKRDDREGSGPGQSWDVNTYGFTGGDSQNKVGTGIGFGGRRQIIGPRPKPGQ